ncbi:MAG: asparagine synthase (glutamine-hydrolyzing) [Armatimonadetes bacterium]|nr:asparagine synthase (glutamine-hydrolyzing) [Armatimonadota bacterium]
MCGIVGIFTYGRGSGVVDDNALLRARDAMVPRGPDGAGCWIGADNHVGLGHRRLAIIDLSPAGAQPMQMEEEGLWITFNGEIYNYKELQDHVRSKGRVIRSGSDTETLLHLYALYGEGMCDHLRGMFAFAIWDERRKGLFLARDHFGIKPLYVARQPGMILFASRVKAIIASGLVNLSPDPAGHVGFYLWGNMPQPFTLYKQIRELPAGHTMWVDEHGVREPRPYFSLTDEVAVLEGTARFKSAEEAREAFGEAVRDTVRHHFVADVPVGVFLSAGRDSTTILAVSTEVNDSPPNAITLGFKEYEGTEDDEVPLAASVAQLYGSKHLCQHVLGSHFQEDLPAILEAMDQPSVDGLNTYYVSKVTREFGMKVALSGLGGDEFLGGYASFQQIPRLVHGLKAARAFPWLGKAFRVVTSAYIGKMTSPKYAGLLEYGPTFGGAYLLRRGLFSPWELPGLLDPDMVREGWSDLKTVSNLEDLVLPLKGDRAKVSVLEASTYMRNRLLRDSDWAGMAHSLEIRVPFVDVGFIRAVAPMFGTEFEPTKADLAQVPKKPLPEEIVNRPKTGFNFPVREWLLGQKPEAGSERSLRGWARLVHQELGKS